MRDFTIGKTALFFLCFVAWTSAQKDDDVVLDPCKQAYDTCEKEWLDITLKDGDKCGSALKWQACLRLTVDNGLCSGTEGRVDVLEQELETHCDQSSVDTCKDAQDQCRQQWSQAARNTKVARILCALAKRWRTCMDDFIMQGRCQKIPAEVVDEEKKSCKQAVAGSTCLNAVEMCQAQWKMKYAYTHPNSLKCKLAQDWDSCVQVALVVDCTKNYAPYPTEITRQEASCGVPDREVDLCQRGKDLCRDAWSSRVGDTLLNADERCDGAKSWEACLLDDHLQQQCDTKVHIPQDVTSALLEFCMSNSDDYKSCSALEAGCNKDFIFSDNDKCDKAMKWRSCLDVVQKKGCGAIIPTTLERQLELCTDTGACATRIESCKTEFDNRDASQDRCTQVKTWRACLEKLLGFCSVTIPRALNIVQAESCYIRQGTVNCVSLSTKCKKDYLENVRVTGKSCVFAEEWRHCLEEVSRKHKCSVKYPRQLDIAQATLCFGRSSSAQSCTARQVKCKAAFDSAASSTNPCQNVRNWRKCLEGLQGKCKVSIPYQLNKAAATHCYLCLDNVATGDTDAAGAHLSCAARMDRCRAKGLTSTPNRCEQTKAWQTCLEGLRVDCLVKYPRELFQVQAVYCYVRKVQAKTTTRPPKKTGKSPGKTASGTSDIDHCVTKQQVCKPANPTSCDDAQKWRACLDRIRNECGTKIYPRDLDTLQATTCYGK